MPRQPLPTDRIRKERKSASRKAAMTLRLAIARKMSTQMIQAAIQVVTEMAIISMQIRVLTAAVMKMRMKMKMEISMMILRALLPHMITNSDTNTPAIKLLIYHACKLLKL